MNKKILSILMSSLMTLSLISCGSSNTDEKNIKEETQKEDVSKSEEEAKEKTENKEEASVESGITKEYIEAKLSDEKVEIINIDNSGDNYYTIDFKVREVASESYYEKNILNEIKQISQLLTESGLVEGNEFFFEAKGAGKDKYGNEGEMNYATAFIKGDELAKCNYDNLTEENFKNILESFGLTKSLQ